MSKANQVIVQPRLKEIDELLNKAPLCIDVGEPTAGEPDAGAMVPFEMDELSRLKSIIESANNGDPLVMPVLKQTLANKPELALLQGNLANHVIESLLDLGCGSDLFSKECVEQAANNLRDRLLVDCVSDLEALLVERIVICWLVVHLEDGHLISVKRNQPTDHYAIRTAEKRCSAAHSRYLSALKTLATVRKLLRPKSPAPAKTSQGNVVKSCARLQAPVAILADRDSDPRDECALPWEEPAVLEAA